MSRKFFARTAVFTALAACSLPSLADNRVTEIALDGVPKGSVALGFGFRMGQSPYVNIDNVSSQRNEQGTDLVPLYYYEGNYLFAHGTSFGAHLLDGEKFSIDLVSQYRFDRIEETDDPFFDGIEERRQSIDGGLAVTWKDDWGELSATAVHDLLDRHQGSEVDISYSYPWRNGKWLLSPSLSYVYQDSTLTNYYYGVSDEEATPERPTYTAGSASSVRAGINTTYQLNKRAVVFANFSLEALDQSVSDSPLVDKTSLATAYLGFAYLFGNALDETEFGRDTSRFGEWSWRVNYGYTAHETFLRVHNGEPEKHKVVDSNLAGLTVGKLLRAGRKVDMWGKFSVNRHLENNLQDDFFSYNGYVMAMGTGYSPWTKKELFRWGFGFGFSYADKIPAVEAYKQRNDVASHYLNYMEAQLDFPLRNFFKASSLKDCYAGLTLVHRSGIFARSDILNNVSGGSDVLTAHLECKR